MAKRSLELIQEFLNREERLRSNAIAALEALGTDDALELIVRHAFEDGSPDVREQAFLALARLDKQRLDQQVIPEINRRREMPRDRVAAWTMLGRLRDLGYQPEISGSFLSRLGASWATPPKDRPPFVRAQHVAPAIYFALFGIFAFWLFLWLALELKGSSPHTTGLLSVLVLAPVLALGSSRRSSPIGWFADPTTGPVVELGRVGWWALVSSLAAMGVVSVVFYASGKGEIPGTVLGFVLGAGMLALVVVATRLGTLIAAGCLPFRQLQAMLQIAAGFALGLLTATTALVWVRSAYGSDSHEALFSAFTWSLVVPTCLAVACLFALIDLGQTTSDQAAALPEDTQPQESPRARLVRLGRVAVAVLVTCAVAMPIADAIQKGWSNHWAPDQPTNPVDPALPGEELEGSFAIGALPWTATVQADFRQDLGIRLSPELSSAGVRPALWTFLDDRWQRVESRTMPPDLRRAGRSDPFADDPTAWDLCLVSQQEYRLRLGVSIPSAGLEELYHHLTQLWHDQGSVTLHLNRQRLTQPAPQPTATSRSEGGKTVLDVSKFRQGFYAFELSEPERFRATFDVKFPQRLTARLLSNDCLTEEHGDEVRVRLLAAESQDSGDLLPNRPAGPPGPKPEQAENPMIRPEFVGDPWEGTEFWLAREGKYEIEIDTSSQTRRAVGSDLLEILLNADSDPPRPWVSYDFELDGIRQVTLEATEETSDVVLVLCQDGAVLASSDDPERISRVLASGTYQAQLWSYRDNPESCRPELPFLPEGESVRFDPPTLEEATALLIRRPLELSNPRWVEAEVFDERTDVVLVLCQEGRIADRWDDPEAMRRELDAGSYAFEVWPYGSGLSAFYCDPDFVASNDGPTRLEINSIPAAGVDEGQPPPFATKGPRPRTVPVGDPQFEDPAVVDDPRPRLQR